jgi:hypothetical protein
VSNDFFRPNAGPTKIPPPSPPSKSAGRLTSFCTIFWLFWGAKKKPEEQKKSPSVLLSTWQKPKRVLPHRGFAPVPAAQTAFRCQPRGSSQTVLKLMIGGLGDFGFWICDFGLAAGDSRVIWRHRWPPGVFGFPILDSSRRFLGHSDASSATSSKLLIQNPKSKIQN